MREDTNIKGADTESDFWLIIYSVTITRVDCNVLKRPAKRNLEAWRKG